jgi:hypothetical protein
MGLIYPPGAPGSRALYLLSECREPVSDIIKRVIEIARLLGASTPYREHPQAHSGSSRKQDIRDEILKGPGGIVT